MAELREPLAAGGPSFFSVIEDVHFRSLLRLSQEQALTWDAFLSHPLPHGMSPLECWNAVMSLGQCLGVDVMEDADGCRLWYRRTSQLEALIDELAVAAVPDGKLIHQVNDFLGMAYTDGLRRQEAGASLALAGMVEDVDAFVERLDGLADPVTAHGKLGRNYFIIDCDLEHYRNDSLNTTLAGELYGRLTQGVPAQDFERPQDAPSLSAYDARAYLARLLSYSSDPAPDDSVILRGMFVGCEILRYRLFGTLSPCMASLITRLFYLQHDLPLLAIAPFAVQRLAWQRGSAGEAVHQVTPADVEATFRRFPGNITLMQTVCAAGMMRAVAQIESQAGDVSSGDAVAREALLSKREFNHRQRSILARALRVHKAEFSARYHQSKNAISYATARRDLTELEEAGYLTRIHKGKGYVFMAGPALEELVQTSQSE